MTVLDWSAVDRAKSEADAAIDEAQIIVEQASRSLTTQVDAVLNTAQPGILDALIGAVSAAGELAAGLLESLMSTKDLFGTLEEFIHDKWAFTVEPLSIIFGQGALASSAILGEYFGRLLSEAAPDLSDIIGHRGSDAKDPQEIINQLNNLPPSVRYALGIALGAMSIFQYASASQAAGISQWQQAALKNGTPTPLNLAQLTELVKRRDIGEGWAKDHATRTGYSGELFDLAMRLEQARLTPDHYITAWLRTKREEHIDEIRKLGVSEEDINRLLYLAFVEPTPSDIVRFLVRDAYDEQAVAENQYDEDFDRKYRQDAFDRIGVSRDLAKLYWRAHWQLPSPTQGYEMVHREQLTMDQLREMLKIADYAPAFIDKLINIAYNVPGRIDLRRMWDAGVITDRAELVRRYGHLGYDPGNAELLATFTLAVTERTRATAEQRKRAPLASQIIRSFMQGTMSEELAISSLQSIGFTPEEAAYKLREGELGRERDRTDRIRDAIGRQYIRGSVTEDDARSKLAGYGFSDAEIAVNFDSWNLDRELRDFTVAQQHEKDLSRADIVAAFETGIMDGASAYSALIALGYDPQEADTILELSTAKQARADAKIALDSVRVQYINRRIDRDQARDALDALVVQQTRRDALLERWTVEREEKAPDLPIAWLERLIFNALISEDDARTEMERRGFTDQEIDWALRLWGEDVSVARERLEQTAILARERMAQQAQIAASRLTVQERALDIRERVSTTAQRLQTERFQQALQQRAALQTERLTAAASGRAASAAIQAERDARIMAQRRELQDRQLQSQNDRVERQITAASERQARALEQQSTLQARREALAREQSQAADDRQVRALQAQLDRLDRQIAAQNQRASDANSVRLMLQQNQQAFQDSQRIAREQATEARAVQSEAARIRQESRQEAVTIRRETRVAARTDIQRARAQQLSEQLRSSQLQRESTIAELTARLAALEANMSEQRIADAAARQAEAERQLAALTGPAIAFEPGV